MDTSAFKQITIYPNPKDGKFEAIVIFNTYEIGNDYITKEYQWCSSEYHKYCGAMNKEERAAAFQKLSIARVAFARMMGYNPHNNDQQVWAFVEDKTPKQIA